MSSNARDSIYSAIAITTLGLVLSGCGGGSSGTSTNTSGTNSSSNTPTYTSQSITGTSVSGPYGIATDPSNNVWITTAYGSTFFVESTAVTSQACSKSTCFLMNAAAAVAPPSRGIAINSSVGIVTVGAQAYAWFNNSYSGAAGYPRYTGYGVAMDSSGNAWAADASSNSVIEYPASGLNLLANAVTFTNSAFNGPRGVAVDKGGNIWITNYGGNSVTEITATAVSAKSCSNATCPTFPGFNSPMGIATDSSGNVWVVNTTGNSVTEITTSAISAGSCSGTSCPTYSGSSYFQTPQWIAVDAGNNVWVSNAVKGAGVAEIKAQSTTPCSSCQTYKVNTTNGTTTTNAASITSGEGIAVDNRGNVWVADNGGNQIVYFVGIATPTQYSQPLP